jgi:hypothetical protein
VTDVLCFGEAACLARARGPCGHLALSLQESTAAALASTELLMVRRDEDGAVHFAGPAAELYDFRRGAPLVPAQAEDWRFSGFRADLFAGIVIGVR